MAVRLLRRRPASGWRGVSRARARRRTLQDLLDDPELDAVVLATPVPTHSELAVRVAQAGKHCFVEKPLATTAADAQLAVDAAERAGKTLMVGHLLEYHPAVASPASELLDQGELGELYYVYGNRLNLGKLRADENALWSLGAHDVSVVLALIGEEPVECLAHGSSLRARGRRGRGRSATCASPRARSRICTCRGWTPQGAAH